MNVLKFGGTSVGSQESINALISLLKPNAQSENPVVVLSAMSGVTNALLEMAENARNLQEYSAALKEVEEKHFKVIRALLPASAQNPVLTKLKIFF